MQEKIKTYQHITDKKIIKIYRNHFKKLEKILLIRWNGMNKRCNNISNPAYGGRGIQNRFKSFNEFFDYVLNELNVLFAFEIKNLQIDRINNDGHYEPGNIRFVTPLENIRNSRVCKHNF